MKKMISLLLSLVLLLGVFVGCEGAEPETEPEETTTYPTEATKLVWMICDVADPDIPVSETVLAALSNPETDNALFCIRMIETTHVLELMEEWGVDVVKVEEDPDYREYYHYIKVVLTKEQVAQLMEAKLTSIAMGVPVREEGYGKKLSDDIVAVMNCIEKEKYHIEVRRWRYDSIYSESDMDGIVRRLGLTGCFEPYQNEKGEYSDQLSEKGYRIESQYYNEFIDDITTNYTGVFEAMATEEQIRSLGDMEKLYVALPMKENFVRYYITTLEGGELTTDTAAVKGTESYVVSKLRDQSVRTFWAVDRYVSRLPSYPEDATGIVWILNDFIEIEPEPMTQHVAVALREAETEDALFYIWMIEGNQTLSFVNEHSLQVVGDAINGGTDYITVIMNKEQLQSLIDEPISPLALGNPPRPEGYEETIDDDLAVMLEYVPREKYRIRVKTMRWTDNYKSDPVEKEYIDAFLERNDLIGCFEYSTHGGDEEAVMADHYSFNEDGYYYHNMEYGYSREEGEFHRYDGFDGSVQLVLTREQILSLAEDEETKEILLIYDDYSSYYITEIKKGKLTQNTSAYLRWGGKYAAWKAYYNGILIPWWLENYSTMQNQ